MTFSVRDRTGQPVEPHTCIFPIMKELGDGTTQLVGTGFFITSLGHFVTAKHVIFDAIDSGTGRQAAPLHAVHFVEGSQVLVRHVLKASYHNMTDVAVGRMDFHILNSTGTPLVNRVPVFTITPPRVGSRVVTFAYPESDRIFRRGESGTFRPLFYSGELLGYSDQPRDRSLVTWPHYTTSIDVQGGASGGPVFDETGRVFGVNCVGGIPGLSYMARVADLLPLQVHDFPPPTSGVASDPTVLDLARLGHVLFEPQVAAV
jgi:hypothetical protein